MFIMWCTCKHFERVLEDSFINAKMFQNIGKIYKPITVDSVNERSLYVKLVDSLTCLSIIHIFYLSLSIMDIQT